MRWDNTLINKLFYDKDPLDGLDREMSYYNRYYDEDVIVTGKSIDKQFRTKPRAEAWARKNILIRDYK